MASMDQDETYDALIFSLGVVLSSMFVLNSMGVIDATSVDRLFLVTELTKHLCIHTDEAISKEQDAGGDAMERAVESAVAEVRLSEYFPPLLWVCRDFVVRLVDSAGGKLSTDQYLESALEDKPGSTKRTVERNMVRSSIKNLFRRRSCLLFPRPVDDEAMLQDGNKLGEAHIKPQFLVQVDALRSKILDVPPKRLFGTELSGRNLVDLARAMVETMNRPEAMPSIKSAWEYVVEQSCADALGKAFEEYSGSISKVAAGEIAGEKHGAVDGEQQSGSTSSGGSSSGGSSGGSGRRQLPRLEEMMNAHHALAVAAQHQLLQQVIRSDGQHAQLQIEATQTKLHLLMDAELCTQIQILQERSAALCASAASAAVAGLRAALDAKEWWGDRDLVKPILRCGREYDAEAQGPAREAELLQV
jgi:uncharacterized membrane protein YgcG